jgi:hypothetical protein
MQDTPNPLNEPDEAAKADLSAADAFELDTAETAVPTQPAPEQVHRWLDGEPVAEADLRTPDAAKHVKFWAKVNEETGRRHSLKTPRGLDAIIMDKLETPVVKDD